MENFKSTYFKAEQAAEYLCISEPTLYRWVTEGRLPKGIPLSKGRTIWRKRDLDNFVDAMEKKNNG